MKDMVRLRSGAKGILMSERNETFVKRCRAAIVKIADSAELERYLRAAAAEEFPVVKPVFTAGETLPMSPQTLHASAT